MQQSAGIRLQYYITMPGRVCAELMKAHVSVTSCDTSAVWKWLTSTIQKGWSWASYEQSNLPMCSLLCKEKDRWQRNETIEL